jgi:ribosomal protein S18 acetylase RimI-like enzyme
VERLDPALLVRTPAAAELAELADVAARTFPLACPPGAAAENIAAFVDEHLSAQRFGDYLTDPARDLVVAVRDGRITGYAMLIHGVPDDADVQQAVTLRPAVELSKIYVLPDSHGAGVSAALMTEAINRAGRSGSACMWLGVNQENPRAQRFYAKHGFTVAGTKTFRLGAGLEQDYVLVRPLSSA